MSVKIDKINNLYISEEEGMVVVTKSKDSKRLSSQNHECKNIKDFSRQIDSWPQKKVILLLLRGSRTQLETIIGWPGYNRQITTHSSTGKQFIYSH